MFNVKFSRLWQVFDKVERLSVIIALASICLSIIIAFYKTPVVPLFLFTLKILLFYVIPGYCLTLYLWQRLPVYMRMLLGVVTVLAASVIISYYFGIFGLHIRYHIYVLPVVFVTVGLLLVCVEKDKPTQNFSEEKAKDV